VAYDRNLASINRKLLKGSEILQETIREQLAQKTSIAVLDIGTGVGMALMELAWMFRQDDVRFTGINKDPGEPLASRQDYLVAARQIALASDAELAGMRLPDLFFEDATHMHFEDESFDVVYASSVLRFVPDKARLLEDVARVLRPGGVALIRVGSKGWDYPYGPVSDAPELTPYGSRWVLKHGNELIPLEAYLSLLSGKDFDLELVNKPHCVIRVTKHRRASLAFGLNHVPELSLQMTQLGYGDEDRGLSKGGVRSVYDVPEGQYRALVDRGLLGPQNAGAGADQSTARRTARQARLIARVRQWAAAAAVMLYTAPMTACAATHTLATIHRFNWKGALFLAVLGAIFMPTAKRHRLSSYRVGQRVNVKGRLKGLSFRAAKIKMVKHVTADDHLEGLVESVDVDRRRIGLLAVTSSLVAAPHGDEQTDRLESLKPGMQVRLKGKCGKETFVTTEISVVPPSPIVIEEIQGPIEAIEPAVGVMQVAGIMIVTDGETKIDRLDAR
jgi:SAM-dependent methyltransferase